MVTSSKTISLVSQNIQRHSFQSATRTLPLARHPIIFFQELPRNVDALVKHFHDHHFYTNNSTYPRAAILVTKHNSMGKVLFNNYISDKIDSRFRGHLTDLVLSWNEGKTLLLVINLYNPTGDNKAQLIIHSQLHQFLGELLSQLATHYPSSPAEIVIGGDFNNILQPKESKKTIKLPNNIKKLKLFIDSFSLQDAYYLRLSKGLNATNRGSNGTNRRLDRFYITEGLSQSTVLTQTNTLGTISTHDQICINFTLTINSVHLGPKRFKLRKHLLPFIAHSKQLSGMPSMTHLISAIHSLTRLTKKAINSLQRHEPALLGDSYQLLNSVFKQNPNTNPIEAFVVDGHRKITEVDDLLAHATSYYKDIFSVKGPMILKPLANIS